jgi:20S proteasome subunit beta 1
MAVAFDGGVVLGADSRTTTGSYIANRVSDKLTPLHERILCCRSGSAADTQALADVVRYHLEMVGVQRGERPTVQTAAVLFKNLCYQNKDQLQAGIIVAGWDKYEGGTVYNIPLGGSLHKQPFAIGGSGSTYIYGYCDSVYRPGMTAQEAEQFVKNGIILIYILSLFIFLALSLAMSRDGSSGGIIRLAIITETGVERKEVLGNELPTFWQG